MCFSMSLNSLHRIWRLPARVELARWRALPAGWPARSGAGGLLLPFVLSLALLLAGMAAPARAGNPALVMDADSGVILHQDRIDQLWFPASLTKLMTLYLVFEALDRGQLQADTSIRVSPRAAAQPAVRLGLRAGSHIRAEDAIRALVTVSSNDAAVVLAEAVAGTEADFARLMSQRARELGMTDTLYRNASGLPDAEQVTSARDQAILAQRLITDFPRRYAVFASRSMTFNGRTRNTYNGLLGSYPGADGLKTGFTCAAGYNMVASAVRDGQRLIAVVLGVQNRGARDHQVRGLLDAGFAGAVSLPDMPLPDAALIGQRPARLELAVLQEPLGRRGCARGEQQARSVWPIESWGLLLGIYPDRAAARRAIGLAQAQLRGKQEAGQALLLEREMENGTSWKALLIGYRRNNAGKVCLRLRSKGIDCIAQPPVVLNLPGYAKR
jgi:D-alanyl-D-alanine carboxypeptidase